MAKAVSAVKKLIPVAIKAFKTMGINPLLFIVPLFLLLVASLLEGLSVALLAPIAKGILEKNFDFVLRLPVLGKLMRLIGADEVSSGFRTVLVICLIILAVTVLKQVIRYAAKFMIAYRRLNMNAHFKVMLFNRILTFGKLYFDRVGVGNLLATLAFVNQLSALIETFARSIESFFTVFVYIFIMARISWQVTLIAFLMVPIMDLSTKWLSRKMRATSVMHAEAHREAKRYLLNFFSCIPFVKSSATEAEEAGRYRRIAWKFRDIDMSLVKKAMVAPNIHEIVMLLSVLFFLLFMGYQVFVVQRENSVIGFVVLFVILRRIQGHFKSLANLRIAIANKMGPLQRLQEVFEDRGKFFVKGGDREFQGLYDAIEFRGVNFSYIKKHPVLKEVSFRAEKNKVTAIVGATGCGKSTIISLLMRFYDCPPGSIFLDGIDIREYDIPSLMRRIAFVSQDAYLFNDTIEYNLKYGNTGVTSEEMLRAVERARLYDFIINSPEKFKTVVGDRGVRLSGGEKQRLALARAMLKNADILVLDEATSALDSITERQVQEAIDEAVKDRTTIVIAHRLSTIRDADRILVVEDGSVSEQGTLEELLQKKARFYAFWEEQKFE